MEWMPQSFPGTPAVKVTELGQETTEEESAQLEAVFGGDAVPSSEGALEDVGTYMNSKSAQREALAGIIAFGAGAIGPASPCSVALVGWIATESFKNCAASVGRNAWKAGLYGAAVAGIAAGIFLIYNQWRGGCDHCPPERPRISCSESTHVLCTACLDAHVGKVGAAQLDGGNLRCFGRACLGHFPAAAVVPHLSLRGSHGYATAQRRAGAAEVMQQRTFQRLTAEQASEAVDWQPPAAAVAEEVLCTDCGLRAQLSLRCTEGRHSLCSRCVNVSVQRAARAGPNAEPARFWGVDVRCRRGGCVGHLRVSDGLLQQLQPETLPLYLEALRQDGRRAGAAFEAMEQRRAQRHLAHEEGLAQEEFRRELMMGA
mmetsp:Transcript_9116/g.20284  ORF Transcript_9116/g.20284 Transcript_9116/m.20284 type:complete len:372 (+) Transcript_9116:87-1202(+)